LLGEYEYAPDDLSAVSLDAPSPLIFGDEPDRLRWDGVASWQDQAGLVVAHTRRIGGPNNELTIDYEWFGDWLQRRELAIVWVEIAGKDVLTGLTGRASPGRLLRTRVRYLRAGVIANLAAVHERITTRPE
jgi:hypothetical protein